MGPVSFSEGQDPGVRSMLSIAFGRQTTRQDGDTAAHSMLNNGGTPF